LSRAAPNGAAFWLLVLAAFLAASPALATIELAVGAEDGTVYVDARATGVFGPELDEALRSGLPARLALELVLYERRAGIWDREVVRATWAVSVLYDLLDEIYAVVDENGDLLLEAEDLGEVEVLAAGVELWPLCPLVELEVGRRHYLGVRFTVEPLSVEEVRDLERWLRGNVRQSGRLRDVPGQLVGILRNRLGLGGHSERARSDDFRPEELPPPE
jgi:hypothetical protein